MATRSKRMLRRYVLSFLTPWEWKKTLSEIYLRFGRVRVNSVAREEYPIVNAELFTNSLTNLAEVSKPLYP